MRVQTCSLSIQTITLIPKIPARQKNGHWPMVKFWLPKEIQLVDNNQCKVPLEGTKNVSIAIKATCPDGPVKEGLKAIVLQMEVHSNVWNPKTGLPTIWVCKENISVDISLKEIDTLVFGTLLMKSTVVNMAGLELVKCVRIIFSKNSKVFKQICLVHLQGFCSRSIDEGLST